MVLAAPGFVVCCATLEIFASAFFAVTRLLVAPSAGLAFTLFIVGFFFDFLILGFLFDLLVVLGLITGCLIVGHWWLGVRYAIIRRVRIRIIFHRKSNVPSV